MRFGRGRGLALVSLHTKPHTAISSSIMSRNNMFINRRNRRPRHGRGTRRTGSSAIDNRPYTVVADTACTNCIASRTRCIFTTRASVDVCLACITTGGCAGGRFVNPCSMMSTRSLTRVLSSTYNLDAASESIGSAARSLAPVARMWMEFVGRLSRSVEGADQVQLVGEAQRRVLEAVGIMQDVVDAEICRIRRGRP